MRTRLVGVIGGLLFAVIVSCTAAAPPPPDQSVSEFCGDWANAVCQVSSRPCYFAASACATYQTGLCMNFVRATQTGSSQYSQPNGKACVDALHDAYGNAPSAIPASTLLAVNATCSKVFVGTKAAGDTCSGANDCGGSLLCARVVGTNMSQCTSSASPKQIGDVCADPGDQCQGDSYCALPASGSPRCMPAPAAGQPCGAAIACAASNRCANGICAPLVASGGSCASNDDCVTHYCDLYPPAQCTDGLTFARGSADCNGISGQASNAGVGAPAEAGTEDAPSGE